MNAILPTLVVKLYYTDKKAAMFIQLFFFKQILFQVIVSLASLSFK